MTTSELQEVQILLAEYNLFIGMTPAAQWRDADNYVCQFTVLVLTD